MAGHNWMEQLQDPMCITQVAIPGTHDSGAYQPAGWWARPMTYAQHHTIAEQLAMGVRALDLRCGLNWRRTNYDLYHGPFQLPDSVDRTLDTIKAHLNDNPTEFVIIMLKFEPPGGWDWSDDLNNRINASLGNYLFRRPNPAPNPLRWPTVGELRGRVLVLSRFGQPHRYHYDTRAWQGNSRSIVLNNVGGGLAMRVQDLYNKPTFDQKIRAIMVSLAHAKAKARGRRDRTILHVNFTSYVVNRAQPRVTGDTLNNWLMTVRGDFMPMCGVICIDAATADIVSHIYNQNQPWFI